MLTRRRIAGVLLAGTLLVVSTLVGGVAPASAVDPAFPSHWPKYRLLERATGNLYLDVSNSGPANAAVQLWFGNNSDAQLWIWETASEGGDYLHPGYNRNLCLDFDGERGWGVPMEVNNCNGSASQRWHFAPAWGGGHQLATHSDYVICVDVPGSNFSAGQRLQLWGCNGTGAQSWTVYAG
ncbi:ricin-type beta-trefoil lectin domain protein [Micromonospora sp. NBC_01699]|uniref:RICIN domain-containing protein n=1 Tax=Micromonospora sp. NBC_01699 TaxID=2975984 RepID=UPI002E3790D5|nr:RICIN domain-containing protein [Micromonospora sp. NBC_01699]